MIRRSIVLLELAFVLLLFFVGVLPRAVFTQSLQRDYVWKQNYCFQAEQETSKDTKDCRSFIYKTLDDPVAFYTAALFVATSALFCITVCLFYAAMQSLEEAKKQFVLDKRPWLQVQPEILNPIRFIEDRITFDVALHIENIGSTPALEVTRGWLFLHLGMHGANDFYVKTRNEINQRMDYMGETILPRQKKTIKCTLDVMQAQIEHSKNTVTLGTGGVAVSFKYRTGHTKYIHETSRYYMVNIDGGYPLHLAKEYCKSKADYEVSLQNIGGFDVIT